MGDDDLKKYLKEFEGFEDKITKKDEKDGEDSEKSQEDTKEDYKFEVEKRLTMSQTCHAKSVTYLQDLES